MSKSFNLNGLHIWKFSNEENNPGYNFAATQDSCSKLSGELEAYLSTRSSKERLIIHLTPVTKRVLRIVNSRNVEPVSFDSLRISVGEELRFKEEAGKLNLVMAEEDTRVFKEAFKAMQKGEGDFEIFDSQAWFWPV